MLLLDMLEDLEGYSPEKLRDACRQYRTNPENRFFPSSGQLIGIMRPEPQRRLQTFKSSMYGIGCGEKKLPSVAAVLRKNGHHAAADRWELKSSNPHRPSES
jgi:hypothetical protein